MLTETLTLGTAGTTELVFTKAFGDAQAGTKYSVLGLAATAAREIVIKGTVDKRSTRRTLIDFRGHHAVPGSTTAAFETARMYINFVRPSFVTFDDLKAYRDRAVELLNDNTELQKILDGHL